PLRSSRAARALAGSFLTPGASSVPTTFLSGSWCLGQWAYCSIACCSPLNVASCIGPAAINSPLRREGPGDTYQTLEENGESHVRLGRQTIFHEDRRYLRRRARRWVKRAPPTGGRQGPGKNQRR